jgi:DNA-directed RNA polymerase sigma subunit (sigma70/sigma32)
MYDQHKYSRGETFLQATRAKATSSTSINNSIAAVAAAGTTTKLSRKKKKKPQINNGQINNGPKITHGIRAKRLSGSVAAGAWYQRDEMMRHDILNREEEVILGQKIVKAKQMRELMISLVEEKKVNEEIIMEAEMMRKLNINDYDYDGIGTYRNENDFDDDDFGQLDNGMDPRTMEQTGYAHLQYDGSILDNRGDQRIASTLVRDGSKLIASSFDADLKYLTQEDVQTILKIKGGKNELRKILTDGARARNKLMRCNFRLVVSVGKKWMGRSNDNGKISDRYNGSWDKPSLDEVIQEGMLGLARAVDKYDPGRGLRFSTYSTHWITSYVRQCFQNAATGCLKVPSQLHDIKVSELIIKTIVASC